ncbi:hypothetical protein AXG93_3546s1040 [Marchantia polymorpha subsp. ruderalis]|nr:hypothetical protein AXG93_3546s1040 [Marchantia polymorpha subsp. ruderalis]
MPSHFSASSFVSPAGLGDAILKNPDLLRELAVGHAKVTNLQSAQVKNRSRLASMHSRASRVTSTQRPVSNPIPARHNNQPAFEKESSNTATLSPWGGSPKAVSDGFSPRTPVPKRSQPEPVTFVSSSPRVRALVSEQRVSPHLAMEKLPEQKSAGTSNEVGIHIAKFKKKEMQERTYQGKRRRTIKPKYTLSKFLSEVEEKDKLNREVDFSVKEHALWHMSISQNVMKSAFSEDVKYYRNKFQSWARGVLGREKKLLGFNIYENENSNPSFTPGAGEGIKKLDRASDPSFTSKDESTMILDIGALTAGDYFGERGLLKKSRRAVSIVTISPVEVLVLNVWDFHRHCDRDVIQALAAHDYRKEEQIYKQYLRNCRWERFKKKILDEVLEAKNFRTYMRIGPRAMRYVPMNEGSKEAKRLAREWK